MKVTCLFIAIFGLALIMGCSETPSGPSTSSVIMPLAVGNEWVSKVTRYNLDSSIDTVYFDTLKILQSTFKNGDSLFAFDGPIVGANRSDGYYITLGSKLQIIAKYPTFSGEVFRLDTLRGIRWDTSDVVDSFFLAFSCETVNTFVSVPAGTFLSNKYQVLTTGTYQESPSEPRKEFENLDEYWYAPGIGEVKSLTYSWSDSLVLAFKRELVSYHLN